MLPKPALLSSIEVPEPALSLSSAGLALLRVLAVSMYFIATIPDNGTTQPALYRPPHCIALAADWIVLSFDAVSSTLVMAFLGAACRPLLVQPLFPPYTYTVQFPPLATLNKVNDGSAKGRGQAQASTLSFAKKVSNRARIE